MKSSDPTINKLHEEYCARSGMDVAMTFNREYLWGLWLRYRPAKSFTVDDLRRVISFLRKQVNTGWSPACLTFRNVVADPEKFEEHLSLALAANTSAASVTTPRKRSAPGNEVKPEDRASLDDFNAELNKFLHKRRP
jgi:hypothetical protein